MKIKETIYHDYLLIKEMNSNISTKSKILTNVICQWDDASGKTRCSDHKAGATYPSKVPAAGSGVCASSTTANRPLR